MNIDNLNKAVKELNEQTEIVNEAIKAFSDLNKNMEAEHTRAYPFLFTTKNWYLEEMYKEELKLNEALDNIKKIKITYDV